jgi:hypothetical protein
MNKHSVAGLAISLAALAAGSAHAVDLIAIGEIDPNARDLSGLSAPLENGVPGDLLGGLGSALAWAGGSTFLAAPDRGPNAVPWNVLVDDTTSYVARFQTLDLALTPVPNGNLPFTLTPTLTATTLLFARDALNYGPVRPNINHNHRNYFDGRSDNFNPATDSGDDLDARLDPEGLRVSYNGKLVYVSDEYGPYIYKIDRATGARKGTIPLPAGFHIANKNSEGALEISGNTSGRVANKGMEGLAITPDGKMLVGFVQSPLIQDGGDGGRANRIITIDLDTGEQHQYCYDNWLDDTAHAYNSSEIVALNSHEFLVLERDGKGRGDGSSAVVKRLYKIDLANATDVSNLTGADNLLPLAVPKTLFLDIRAALNAAGIADTAIPAKIEGAAFGADVTVDGVVKHTLYLANDNDFLATAPDGQANPNQWFVFTFTDDDLGGSQFVPQQFKK